MTYKAFILGNGPSRPKDVEWLNSLEGDTYGCNALYRDWKPDFLVVNDWAMMLEILNSTYSGNCCFTDFEQQPKEALEGIRYTPEYKTAIHIGEQDEANSFVFSGGTEVFLRGGEGYKDFVQNFLINNQYWYIVWLDESFRHITWNLKPQFKYMSTGLCALQLALETGYDEIDVIGFNGLKDRNYKNIYDGTENYKFDPAAPDKVRVPETYVPLDASHWESVYIELVKGHPNTKINLI